MLQRPIQKASLAAASVVLVTLAGCEPADEPAGEAMADSRACLDAIGGEVLVAGGRFRMGGDVYPHEAPLHEVRVDDFRIDAHEVTNKQFAEFVAATGYVTVAERVPDPAEFPGAPPEMLQPGAVVFTPPSIDSPGGPWWSYVPGANWRHPQGPDSDIDGRDHYPVVQIAFEDAAAYAAWAGRRLPTEAEYEYAARSGRDGERYAWGGDELAPEGRHLANTWQGLFPVQNTEDDGYTGAAPVGCYPANDYGAFDMIGNVWEWTASWYRPQHDPADNDNPQGPPDSYDPANEGFPVKVIKGGSYLCAPNYCRRYRPAARHAQDMGLGTSHIGFRTVAVTTNQ